MIGERGTSNRGTAQRGTSDRGTSDARPPLQVSQSTSPSPNAPARSPSSVIGVFVYQVGAKGLPESGAICPESDVGPWHKCRLTLSFKDIATVLETVAPAAAVGKLGVLAHGDSDGTLIVGKDVLTFSSLSQYHPVFSRLNLALAPAAEVYIYGCISGHEAAGTLFLQEISRLLPEREIIGFNSLTTVQPLSSRRVDGKPCYDPDPWTTGIDLRKGQPDEYHLPITNDLQMHTIEKQLKKGLVYERATRDAKAAKVARNGRVIRWPASEQEKQPGAVKAKEKVPPAK
jgi:hypothetical protein